MQSLKRIGKPNDIADVIAFLAPIVLPGSLEPAFPSMVDRNFSWTSIFLAGATGL
jgi:membrane protein YqaA with SNARE-associated domain